jgi:hypothetical protein
VASQGSPSGFRGIDRVTGDDLWVSNAPLSDSCHFQQQMARNLQRSLAVQDSRPARYAGSRGRSRRLPVALSPATGEAGRPNWPVDDHDGTRPCGKPGGFLVP